MAVTPIWRPTLGPFAEQVRAVTRKRQNLEWNFGKGTKLSLHPRGSKAMLFPGKHPYSGPKDSHILTLVIRYPQSHKEKCQQE